MEYQNIRYRVVSLLTLICALFCCNAAIAQNEDAEVDFYLNVPTIQNSDPVQVDIMLDNPNTPVVGYSFTIKMPEGLEIVKESAAKTERFSAQQIITVANNKCLVVSMNNDPFAGVSGSVGSFKIQATQAYLEAEKETKIVLSNITLSGLPQANGMATKVNVGSTTKEFPVKISEQDPVQITVTAVSEKLVVNPGQSALVTLSMENNKTLNGLQFDVVLPEGFTFAESGIQQSERLTAGSLIQDKTANGRTTVMIYNMSTNKILAAGSGSIVSFTVNVPEDFATDEATVLVNNIKASVNLKTVTIDGTSITIVNGSKSMEQANAVIKGLEEKLAAAIDTIAQTCPDVKDLYPGSDIATRISDLKAAVEAAYNNGELKDKYEEVMAPATSIEAAIEQLVADAKAAQKAYEEDQAKAAALKEAFDKANAVIKGLEEKLAAALDTIAQTCPDVKDLFPGSEISTRINELKAAVEAAYNNGELIEKYDEVMAPATSIEAAIDQLVADAKAAQKAGDDEKAAEIARQTALTNANAIIADLNKALADALATIAEDCPDVKNDFKGEAIAANIAAMQAAIQKAYEDKTIVENFDTLVAPEKDIEAAIAKLVEDAKAAQKAFEAKSALDQAKAKANTTLNDLDLALANALAEIEKTCPDVKHLYTGSSIQQQITVLRNAVNTAYDNKTLATDYDTVMAPAKTIQDAITALVTDAKAAQKAAEDAEKERVENNKKAYEADLAAIEKLRTQLADAKAEIDKNYKEYNYASAYTKILDAINALKQKADKEYARVAKEGTYNYEVDPMPVEQMIENMLNEAKASGVASIFAEELNDAVAIYTLDGKKVSTPQQGKVNIVVKADGTRYKVMVK